MKESSWKKEISKNPIDIQFKEIKDPYFYPGMEYIEEVDENLTNPAQINTLLPYRYQSLISIPVSDGRVFEDLSEKLKGDNIEHKLINLYPQLQS